MFKYYRPILQPGRLWTATSTVCRWKHNPEKKWVISLLVKFFNLKASTDYYFYIYFHQEKTCIFSIHLSNKGSLQQKGLQSSPKRIELFKEGEQLNVRIRRSMTAAAIDQQMPNNLKRIFIFKALKNAESNMKTEEPKQKSICVRSDKEMSSVSYFSGGYHISN